MNTAARMQSHCDPGHVHISSSTYAAVKDNPKFQFEERKITAKGKGDLTTYFVWLKEGNEDVIKQGAKFRSVAHARRMSMAASMQPGGSASINARISAGDMKALQQNKRMSTGDMNAVISSKDIMEQAGSRKM